MQRALNVVVAVWAGSLLTICGLVAPSLFALLSERSVAGEVAGYFFRLEAWLGLALGTIALLFMRRLSSGVRTDYLLLIAAMVAPLVSELVLHPLMDAARASANMGRFGMLHGLSALLFAVACIAATLLLWRVSVPTHKSRL